ncbi:hypothetical protein C3941_03610 [Kaistia algarum]|uniref:hypothetical protein n=1 Tax=Kaistia algarum TaxID=2083279 RepID=UPI000CE836F1|nr:hypothetical protein [Kaistia algarum]MCX5512701.1 hypothetical protein [Kaistia algarum]PPE81792.1 hypothetical protein C3941_03610 [Kaistia algarum]
MCDGDQVEAFGYRSHSYARSFGEASEIIALPRSGGHLIARSVGPGLADLASVYPIFCCQDWSGLADDIRALKGSFVSATIVTDPFSAPDLPDLLEGFDIVRLLHEHYVVDLKAGDSAYPSRHHRRKLRSFCGENDIRIENSRLDSDYLDRWVLLYQFLVDRKQITDVRTFSRDVFERQMGVPGLTVFSAWRDNDLLGSDWYFQDGDNVYAHLSAYSDAGYERAVSYPLMQAAIEYFRPIAKFLTLGGVPAGAATNGLAYFKAGWATRVLPTYLCGAVLCEAEFLRLNGGISPIADGYFPRYRQGEFAGQD